MRSIEETLERLWRPGPTGAGTLLRILQDPKRAGALPDSWCERLLNELAAMGWELVYVTWPMMTDRTQLISLIERVYRARSAPKPPIGSA